MSETILSRVFHAVGRRIAAHPAPRPLVALYLSLRFRAVVSPHADIAYPFRLRLGRGARLGRCVIICTGPIDLGRAVHVREGALLDASWGTIRVGDETTINAYCVVYGGQGGVTIGKKVGVATQSVFIPSNHGFEDGPVPMMDQPITMKGIVVEDDVWIGARAVILDGVRVSTGAVVAAGAVVHRNVESGAIVGGVPARTIRNRRDPKRKEG